MPESVVFADLIRRVRGGDQDAATELVRRYEPAIRRAARLRLVHAGLQGVLDSVDICQSVWKSFFVRVASGQYEFNQPEQLLRLLATMTYNKVVNETRKQHAERRDHRRAAHGEQVEASCIAPDPSPSVQLSMQETLQEVHRRLSPLERQLMELRNQGLSWAAIAAQLGETPIVLRKKLSRALDRVTRELGLETSP